MQSETGRRKTGSTASGGMTALRGAGRAGLVTAVILLTASAAFAQKKIPVPRPSPLGDAGTAVSIPVPTEVDPARNSPEGLSPGALLDPTRSSTEDVALGNGFGPDANGGEPMGLAPNAQPTEPFGANPLLGSAPPTAAQVRYLLEARLQNDGEALPSGVTWRVFAPHPAPDGKLPLIGEARGGAIEVSLQPGDYLVHAAYGRAGATKKITVGPAGGSDAVIINAGGLKLTAMVDKDEPLAPTEISFDVYAPDEDGSDERILLVPNAPPDQVIGLNAGVYHVICRYGDANAVVRAEIRVEPGKLTEATVYQKAARLTLKLVGSHGGEALANTKWAILTPQGDSVVESVGAFPSVVLAAGDYTAVASHEGRSYERNFTVETGLNRDVEVIAK
jgi:hypothetical protein